jgi:hypothetical protein
LLPRRRYLLLQPFPMTAPTSTFYGNGWTEKGGGDRRLRPEFLREREEEVPTRGGRSLTTYMRHVSEPGG